MWSLTGIPVNVYNTLYKFKPVFRCAQARHFWVFCWVLSALIVLQFLLVLLTGRGAVDFSGVLMKMVAGLFIFVPISAIAFWHDFPRGYLHALLLGMAIPAYMTFGSDIPILATGVVILAVGVTVLVRFLREFPPPGEMS